MEFNNIKWRCTRHGTLLKAHIYENEAKEKCFEAHCPRCLDVIQGLEKSFKKAEAAIFSVKDALAHIEGYGKRG